MSNESSQGGPPQEPPHGGSAEDGYPTQPIPQHPYPPQPSHPQGPPQGYSGPPQQGQPPQGGQYAQGQPQQGGPYAQGQPQQGGPYAQGQPPQGYGQPYQSYDQGQGTYGLPPKKSKTGMIIAIIAIVVALVLAGVVWFVMSVLRGVEAITLPEDTTTIAVETPSDEPTTEPTADETTGAETSTDPGGEITLPTEDPETDGDATAGAPPVMPAKVGDYTAIGDPEPEFALYMTSDMSSSIVAIHVGYFGLEDFIAELDDAKKIGIWTCGLETDSEASMCVGEAHGGVISITGSEGSEPLAAWGDEFLALWK